MATSKREIEDTPARRVLEDLTSYRLLEQNALPSSTAVTMMMIANLANWGISMVEFHPIAYPPKLSPRCPGSRTRLSSPRCGSRSSYAASPLSSGDSSKSSVELPIEQREAATEAASKGAYF